MKKRMIALLLCLCMTLLPIQGLALEGDGGTEEPASPRLLWRFDLYVPAEDTMEPQPRLEVENLPDPKKFPDGTTAFQFPCQPGKTGTIAVESADAFKDATIKVTQNGKELENLNDLNGGSTFHADKVSLEKGSTITIIGEKNGAASQYTIEMVEKDAPSFTISPISGAGPGYKLTPAFNKKLREYVLTVPADAETLAFNADPGDGREFRVHPRAVSEYDNNIDVNYYIDPEEYEGKYHERDYNGYWYKTEDVVPVPLIGYCAYDDKEPTKATKLDVEIGEDHVYQSYRFRIIRAEPGKAELTDDLFGVKQLLFYDGKPHSADLMIVSSVLDKDKLTFTFDDASTEVIEKLASVTDAGGYNIYVSYAGDDVYAPVTDKLLMTDNRPLTVYLNKAELEVVNTLPAGNKLTLTYSPVAQEVDIPELKVVDASGKEVAGSWNVYKTTSAGTNYNANADFQFADESMSRNYYVGSVRINLTQTPLVLSQEDLIKDLQIDSSEQDPEQGFVYPYTPSGYYQFPRVSVWTLGTLMRYLNNNGTEYEYFKVKYSFHDKDGNELGEDDGVKINKNTGYPESGPTAVGEYKLRLTVPVSSLHSSLGENVKFKDDKDIVYDIPYEIVPREITPKVLLNATVYRIDENRIIVSPDIDCHDELGPDVFIFFKTEFKFGDKVIQPNSSRRYDPYDLTTTENDPNFTFTISLKDENKNNYILSEDSVLTASLNPNGERVTPVASSDAVVVHKYDGNSYTNEKDLSGTINLQGLPAGKDVSCRIAGIALENSNGWTVTAPGDNYKATVHLMLTGKDAGEYLLTTDTITVPASIVKRSLNDPDVYIWVNNPSMTYYESSEEPFEPLVRVNVQGSTIASGDKTYKVTYLNNIYPSVRGSGEECIYAKAVVTAAEDGYFTGSVTKDFYIGYPSSMLYSSQLISIKKGETKDFVIESYKPLDLKWDDKAAIDVQAGEPEGNRVTLTIKALREGEAILLVKRCVRETYPGYISQFDAYYNNLYGITVTDDSASAQPIPSTVFAGSLNTENAGISNSLVKVNAEVGDGQEESGLGLVKPVTVSGQIYPIDKDGYKFILNAVPGYEQATGYKMAIGKNAGGLDLSNKALSPLDEKVTNGRSGMSHTFLTETADAMKALTGTLVRLQWYEGNDPLGQPEIYRLNFDRLKFNAGATIESVKVYQYSPYSLSGDIAATVDNDAKKIILKGKAPEKDTQYSLAVYTSVGGYVYPKVLITPPDNDTGSAQCSLIKYSGYQSPVLNDDLTGFYILNQMYTIDASNVKSVDLAAPVTTAKVADTIQATEEQKEALKEVISQATSTGLTAALVADDQIADVDTDVIDEGKAALREVVGDDYDEGKVTTVIQPYLDITVTEYGTEYGTKTLAVNIDAMCRTVVTTADDPSIDGAVKVAGETANGETANAVRVGEPQKVTVDTPITISLKLPDDFISGGSSIYVKHTKGEGEDARVYYYSAYVNSAGIATFISTHGLSPFEIALDFNPQAEICAPDASDDTSLYYTTLQEAVDAVQNGQVIKVFGDGGPATVSRTVCFTAIYDADGNPYTAITAESGFTNTGDSGSGEYNFVSDDEDKPGGEDQPAPWENPYNDVKTGDWFYSAVEYVTKNGLMQGVSHTKFAAQSPLTRAQFAQIIYNKAGRPTVTSKSRFTDVDPKNPNHWYANPVIWAAEKGVVKGIGNNQFAPDRDITREELATMLWRYAGHPKPTKTALNFKDADKVSTFAQEAMLWANELGIVNGKGHGILDPKGKATRAEAAKMLMNYLKK